MSAHRRIQMDRFALSVLRGRHSDVAAKTVTERVRNFASTRALPVLEKFIRGRHWVEISCEVTVNSIMSEMAQLNEVGDDAMRHNGVPNVEVGATAVDLVSRNKPAKKPSELQHSRKLMISSHILMLETQIGCDIKI